MGVDYSGNFGVGFQVYIPELEEEHEYYDDDLAYVEFLLEDKEFYYFEVGEGSYTGEKNDIFVCLDVAFIDGKFNNLRAAELKEFLILHDLILKDTEIDSVGGLNVW
jgi:hypothetical protein